MWGRLREKEEKKSNGGRHQVNGGRRRLQAGQRPESFIECENAERNGAFSPLWGTSQAEKE